MNFSRLTLFALGALIVSVACNSTNGEIDSSSDSGGAAPSLDDGAGGESDDGNGAAPSHSGTGGEVAMGGSGSNANDAMGGEADDGNDLCIDNGSCDSVTECLVTDGVPSCGDCPQGYVGNGETGCRPVLIELEFAEGLLSPSLNESQTDYRLSIPLRVENLKITPRVAPDVQVRIEGEELREDGSWTAEMLAEGDTALTLITSQEGRQSTSYRLIVGREKLEDYIKASNSEDDDIFGWTVALSNDGTTMAVGAYGEDSLATGLNGDQGGTDTNSSIDAGAVYVFVQDTDGEWLQQAYLKASNAKIDAYFGSSLALSDSGNILAIGASKEASAATGVNGDQEDESAAFAGAAYVFTRDQVGEWSQQAYIKASNTDVEDYFGTTVALSGDGGTLAVGATNERSATTGVNGDQDDNSALFSGAVYVFTYDEKATWAQEAYIKASNTNEPDYFSSALALSADGRTLAVGAYYEYSASTGVNGDQEDNTASYAGAAYVFTRDDEQNWSQQAYVKASNTDKGDQFGWSVALSAPGNTLAVGAPLERSSSTGVDGNEADNMSTFSGAAYLYSRDGNGSWSQQAYVKASNTDAGDYFGTSVALSADGRSLAVGAYGEESNSTGMNGAQHNASTPSGAAYLFRADESGTWSQEAYVKGSSSHEGDFFGWSVALTDDGKTLAVGAPLESSAAKGVNGDHTDESARSAGAVFLYYSSSSGD